ncbi:11834_t:CDS:10 [Ambispora gerdemannii]|uniref:11834_t:CDS:1 n=1 Tax=Ambispora gerdemannii TaxID=144530 RepID=A0A9N9CH89_9GLOM|nr:11834_t:CDS:10 [Ambispora gerdemannii]
MFALCRATSRAVQKSSIISLANKYVTPRTLPALASSSTRVQLQQYEQRSSFATTTATRIKRNGGTNAGTASALAPNWEARALVNGEIEELSLDSYLQAKRYVVMIFYPFDFTFVCPTELIAFSERIDEFEKLGADVVGISCDSIHSHYHWNQIPRKQGGVKNIKFPLVADFTKKIASTYGVLHADSHPLRGLIVIDDEGFIRAMQIYDEEIGRSVDEALRVIRAIQFNKKYGDVCPANWKEGEATIKPDHKKKKSFFENLED